ncbi:MAG: prkC 3 [Schlesneria sp.]|nr:prkC 3 [Schlesneria sp.]
MNERDIFLSALEIEDPSARQAFLHSACAGDTNLLASVESLLASHGQSQFLNTPAVQQMSNAESAETMLLEKGSTADDEYPDMEFFSHSTDAMKKNENDDDNPLDYLLGFLQPASRPDSKGRLAHYEILEVLGRGAFGTVLKAFDSKLERVVAIKVLAPEMAVTSPARKRFLREARASAQIRHENVVAIYAVEEQPLPYLVMEYIPGKTLQQRLDDVGPLGVTDVLRLGQQIAAGLSAAHSHNLIHRDIKPGNILLESGVHERVKITDFGLARAVDDASMTQSSVIAGTPMYMAPEQALGRKLDQRADLFSLGSVLYQMVSGRPPFRASSTLAVLKRVTEDTPRPITEVIPETPQWLCDIITKLHAKNPDERYQTAQEVVDVLADCESQLKEHSRLRDLSLIPRPKTRPTEWWKVAAALALVAPMLLFGLDWLRHWSVEDEGKVTGTKAVATSIPESIKPEPFSPMATATAEQGIEQVISVPPSAIAPFDAAQARAHQKAWAKYLSVPVEFMNEIGMKFRLIPPGEFTMGTSPEDAAELIKNVTDWAKDWVLSETPARKVQITEPFYLGTTEVTVGQFKQFVAMTGYKTQAETNGRGGDAYSDKGFITGPEFTWRHPDLTQSDAHPVGQLCPEDANAFCSWLQKLDGRTYQLPDEEQWEYACRAGTVTPWSFGAGDDLAKLHGLTGWNLLFTGRAVAQSPANPFGLFDVHGNFEEMCHFQHEAYINRGGSSGLDPLLARSASRGTPIDRLRSYFQQSFRVAVVGNLKPSGSSAKPEPLSATLKNTMPFTDADVQRIAALPAVEQIEEVRKELVRRNPGFDGKVETKVEDGVVTELRIVTDQVTDIGPIRVFNSLRMLNFEGTQTNYRGNGQLADLSPLMGMNVTGLTYLHLDWIKVGDADLACFRDCKNLMQLNLGHMDVGDSGLANFKDCKKLSLLSLIETQLSDAGLAHFQDCKDLTWINLAGTKVTGPGLIYLKDCTRLTYLHLDRTQVGDAGTAHFKELKNLTSFDLSHTPLGDAGLAHFKDMPLSRLWIHNTHVSNLKPLQGMALEEICLTPKNITMGLDILRDMKSLKTIGINHDQAWPAGEFWERYDKGEFSAAASFTDADAKRIAALPAVEQVEEVRKELMRLNPKFDGKITPTIDNGVVTELSFNSDQVDDIAPVRALTKLVYLDCRGTYPNKGKLANLSPLKGMALRHLDCSSTQIADLTPLAGMPLTNLQFNHNPVDDLTPIQGMPLQTLSFAETKVTDLSPLKGMKIQVLGAQLLLVTDLSPLEGMPLTGLDLYHTVGVTSLEPLKGMPLEVLNLQDVPVSDLSPLKGMMTLRTLHLQQSQVSDLSPLAGLKVTDLLLQDQQITDLSPLKGLPLTRLVIYNTGASDLRPLAGMPLHVIRLNPKNITQGIEVLREIKSLKTIGIDDNKTWPAAEFWERYDKKEFALAPFTEADVQRIAALPAAEQVEEVRKELMKRSSAFDGKVEHKIEDGVVTELKLITDEIVDISPVRALQKLVSLKLSATAQPGKRSKLSDISPLRGLPLTHLDLGCTAVTNIEVLKEMPLADLSLDRVPVADLSPLTGKVLKSLHFGGTKVKSLSEVPIASSEVIHCHLTQISDKAELQRWGVRFLDLWGVPTTADPERLRELKPPLSRVNGKPLEEFLKEAP